MWHLLLVRPARKYVNETQLLLEFKYRNLTHVGLSTDESRHMEHFQAAETVAAGGA